MSDDDNGLFKKAMKGVTPSDPTNRARVSSQKTKPSKSEPLPQAPDPYYTEWESKEDWIEGEDCIQFARGGIQHRVLQKLRRGQISIEARLDLHGFTAAEAIQAIDRFIAQCREQHIRWACIIHGKGRYSGHAKPVLKNVLNKWLRLDKAVLAFHSAQPKDGGTGAVYVLLKTQ